MRFSTPGKKISFPNHAGEGRCLVSAKDQTRWEVQWHPASGAGIRRLVFTWRGARRLLLTLVIATLAVVACGLVAGRTPRAVDAAKSENSALKARQEALLERLEAIEKELAASRVESGGTQESVALPGTQLTEAATRPPER